MSKKTHTKFNLKTVFYLIYKIKLIDEYIVQKYINKKTQAKFMRSFRPNASINFVSLMVSCATFSNISVISLRSVLLVEETGGPGKKTTDLSQVTDKLYLIMLY